MRNPTASLAAAEIAWRTALTAHSTLRPRVSASPWMSAAASVVAFLASVVSIGPPICTGVAAPMLVPGAIAATWLAVTMNTPAEAARDPGGET